MKALLQKVGACMIQERTNIMDLGNSTKDKLLVSLKSWQLTFQSKSLNDYIYL